jgi:hypothetical protein
MALQERVLSLNSKKVRKANKIRVIVNPDQSWQDAILGRDGSSWNLPSMSRKTVTFIKLTVQLIATLYLLWVGCS